MARSETESQVISVSTILILSGVIVGLTIQQFVNEELSPYLLAAGLSGFLAFLALDFSGVRRTEEAQKVEQEQMEDRLDKHTHSLTSVGFILEPISSGEMEAIDPDSDLPCKIEPTTSATNDQVTVSA